MRWVALAMVLLLAPAASAAPVPTGDVEFHLFRDEEAGEYVVSPDGAAPYSVGNWGSTAVYTHNGREWAFAFVDLDGPFRLDASGPIRVTTHVGGGSAEEVGTAEVGWELVVDGEIVASGEPDFIVYAGTRIKSAWTVAAPDVVIDNGDVFRVYTTAHLGRAVRMDLEASGLSLPVLESLGAGSEVPTIHEDLTGDALERTFENATEIQRLNWTVTVAAGDLSVAWDMQAGSLDLIVTSPAGQAVYEGPVAGVDNMTVSFQDAAGVWNITLAVQDASGRIAFGIGSPATGPGSGADPADVNGTRAEDQNGTDGDLEGGDHGKDSPALPLVLVFAALLWARRRR